MTYSPLRFTLVHMLRFFRLFSTVTLRDYQQECIKTSLEHFRNGINRQAVSLPVGAGKTVILGHLIAQLPDPNEEAKKTLVLAHREELLLQACSQISKCNPGKNVQLEKGDIKADVKSADIIVASVPTLGRRSSASSSEEVNDRLRGFDPRLFKCIIIDEAHHSAAPSYRRIMEHFGAFRDDSHLLVWGCSATLRRFDDRPLDLFQKVIFHVDLLSLMQSGWLCPVEVFQIGTELNLQGVRVKDGDFSAEDLSLALNTPNRNFLIAQTWQEEALKKHNRKSTLVFAINHAHVYGLAEAFKVVCGLEPAILTGKTDPGARTQMLADFRQGKIPVIINCAVLTEGTDLPSTDCVLLARPTCNSTLYIQMVGRGLRCHPGKDYCLVLDVVDALRSPKRSLITFPTLLAAKEAAKGKKDGEEAATEADEEDEEQPKSNKSSHERIKELDFDSVKVSIKAQSVNVLNLEGERLAWVSIPEHPIHVLDCAAFRIVLLEENCPEGDPNCFTAIVTSRKTELEEGFDGFERGSAGHAYRETIGSKLRLVQIMPKIDEFIAEHEQRTGKSILPALLSNAYWRRSCPPTPKQLAILLKAAKSLKASKTEISAIYGASKGRAAACITRLNFLRSLPVKVSFKWTDLF